MTNLCVVSYYGPIETIGLAEKELESTGINVFDFPLYKYMHDTHDKVNNYIDLFVEFLLTHNIKYVLWWFINIPTNEFILIKERTSVKYIFFNWDEPYNWPACDIVNKMPYFDAVFVTCKESLDIYKSKGCDHAYCLYPGFDKNTNYMISEMNIELYNKYNCDISICCTNLYENEKLYPDQYINRKKLIDNIYNGQFIYNYKFYIYGPEYVKSTVSKII